MNTYINKNHTFTFGPPCSALLGSLSAFAWCIDAVWSDPGYYIHSLAHSRWWKFSGTINSNEPITELYWCWWDGSYLCSTKHWFITNNKLNFFSNFPKIHSYTSTFWTDNDDPSFFFVELSVITCRIHPKSFQFWKAILVCSLVILSCYIVLCSESLCSQNENKIK